MTEEVVGMQNGACHRRVVGIGASAGGVQALSTLMAALPSDLDVGTLVVLHLSPGVRSALPQVLGRSCPLRVVAAHDGAEIEPGTVYVASPDRHLVVVDRSMRLTGGPTENSHRPSINALFRSLAVEYGSAAVGILLSGVLDDGVAGLAAIRSRGGATAAQLPSDCMFPAMPTNAIEAGVVDTVATATGLADLIGTLARELVEVQPMEPDAGLELENRIAGGSRFARPTLTDNLGPPSGFTCPDCAGSLVETGNGTYRCRVGHGWTAEALMKAQDVELEAALWVALRSLQEKAKLSTTLADRAASSNSAVRARYTASAAEASDAASVLRRHLADMFEPGGVPPDP